MKTEIKTEKGERDRDGLTDRHEDKDKDGKGRERQRRTDRQA